MKLTLADTASGYNLSPINNNFSLIQTELQDRVLYRDNPSGEPNFMEQELDMNNYRIYNVADGIAPSDAVNRGQVGLLLETLGTEFIATSEEKAVATAGQSAFNLSTLSYEPGLNNLAVYINGVRQNKEDFIESNKTTVTIVGGAQEGDVLTFISNERQGEINLNNLDAYITNEIDQLFVLEKELQTASDGQTVFNLQTLTYTPNSDNLSVYVNGVRQYDYSETSSSSVTFTTGLTSGDEVQFLTNKFQETNTVDAEGFANTAFDKSLEAEASATKAEQEATAAGNSATSASNSASAAATSESNALTSANNAAVSESNAATSASNASTSETNAGLFEDKAQQWANEAEDTEVEPGLYSAFHWSEKAEEFASQASGSFIDTAQTGELQSNSVWLIDSTSVRTRALPPFPANDTEIRFVDDQGQVETNNTTIQRNGNLIMGLAQDLTVDTNWTRFSLKFISGDWRIV